MCWLLSEISVYQHVTCLHPYLKSPFKNYKNSMNLSRFYKPPPFVHVYQLVRWTSIHHEKQQWTPSGGWEQQHEAAPSQSTPQNLCGRGARSSLGSKRYPKIAAYIIDVDSPKDMVLIFCDPSWVEPFLEIFLHGKIYGKIYRLYRKPKGFEIWEWVERRFTIGGDDRP